VTRRSCGHDELDADAARLERDALEAAAAARLAARERDELAQSADVARERLRSLERVLAEQEGLPPAARALAEGGARLAFGALEIEPGSERAVAAAVGVMALVGFALTNLGLLIAWRMDSTQGFHAIMNLVLIPLWLLSGSLFPIEGAPAWLRGVMLVNPLSYCLSATRHMLYHRAFGERSDFSFSLAVIFFFCVTVFISSMIAVRKKPT